MTDFLEQVFSEAKMGEYFVQEDETAPGAGEVRWVLQVEILLCFTY